MLKKYEKLIYCILLLLLFVIITMIIKNYSNLFFSTTILIFLCSPIYKFLCKNKIFNNKINAVFSIIIINLSIFISFIYIGGLVIDKISILVSNEYKVHSLDKIVKNIIFLQGFNINEFITKIKNYLSESINNDFIKKGAYFTTDGIISYFVGNIVTYFILVDKYVILYSAEVLIAKEKIKLLLNKIRDVKKVVYIEVVLILLTTLETIVGFLILGIDNAFFTGILCGVLDILPYVGTILIFIPLVLYEFYIKNYIIAVGLICLYILLQLNRQILESKLISARFNVHPLFIILSIFISVKIFGVIGLFMGPIYVITVKEVILS